MAVWIVQESVVYPDDDSFDNCISGVYDNEEDAIALAETLHGTGEGVHGVNVIGPLEVNVPQEVNLSQERSKVGSAPADERTKPINFW